MRTDLRHTRGRPTERRVMGMRRWIRLSLFPVLLLGSLHTAAAQGSAEAAEGSTDPKAEPAASPGPADGETEEQGTAIASEVAAPGPTDGETEEQGTAGEPEAAAARKTEPETKPEAQTAGKSDERPGDAEQEDDDNFSWVPLPAIAYLPETSLLLGAVSIFAFHIDPPPAEDRKHVRKSSVMVVAAATFRKQFLFEGRPNLYVDRENWQFNARMEGRLFPTMFWGVGNDTPDSAREDYTERVFGIRAIANRRLWALLRGGLALDLRHRAITESESDGLIHAEELRGSRGGFQSAMGPTFSWDSRDNNFATRRGGRYEITSLLFTKYLGSDFNYTLLELDLRHFWSLWFDHVLAAQLYIQLQDEGAPFQELSLLGGGRRMRGFYEGRYRDQHMLEAQLEYRFPVVWILGMTTFVGVGDVAPSVEAFDFREFKVAGGVGVRIGIDRDNHINVRLDFAVTSDGDFNFYLDLGEAF